MKQATAHEASRFIHGLSEHISYATINSYRAGISGLYRYLTLLEIIAVNPFDSPLATIPRGKARPRTKIEALSRDEARLLLSTVRTLGGPRDYAIIALLFGAALRPSEVLGATVSGLELVDGQWVLALEDTKTRLADEVTLSDWVAEAVNTHLNTMPAHGPMFPISSVGLWKMFKRWLVRAGLDTNYSPHAGRVTAATCLMDDGVSLEDISNGLRHASTRQTEHYIRRHKLRRKAVLGGLRY